MAAVSGYDGFISYSHMTPCPAPYSRPALRGSRNPGTKCGTEDIR